MTKKRLTAKSLMTSYTKNKYVSSVRRNLYVANDLATGVSIANKFEIASSISTGCYVAYHSALEYYGLSHQQSFDVQVCGDKRFRSFTFEGISYGSYTSKVNEGVIQNEMDSLVRVTDLERTIIDCTDQVELAGGFEELMNCLSACKRVDMARLLHYAKLYNKMVLYRKVGLLCEAFVADWKPSVEQLKELKQLGGRSVLSFTDRNESTKFLSDWKMYVPDLMCHYLTKGIDNEII